MSDLISKLSDLRSQYNCFDESERDAYETLSEAIKVLSAPKEMWDEVVDYCANDVIAIEAVVNHLQAEDPELFCPDGFCSEVNEAFDGVPSAQPERKKGKWVKENIVLTSNPPQYQWHCSECGKIMRGFSAEVLTDYCPSCGADMRGDQNG